MSWSRQRVKKNTGKVAGIDRRGRAEFLAVGSVAGRAAAGEVQQAGCE